jgi:hypothetical protein
MKTFASSPASPPSRSNVAIVQDFLDLSFRLESGRPLDAFSRFTAPMRVRLAGDVPPTAGKDLAGLVARLRTEAGLPIAMVEAGDEASITVEFLPRRSLHARARDAACFVAPRISSWAEYRRAGAARLDWATFTYRDQVAVFIPSDTSPQEIRDCLHEEISQALGPLNDLFRLPDSIFNDDNIHGVLTGFDMLVLRATYAPELTPGMSEAEVSARLPGIIARLNPGGAFPGSPIPPTPRVFRDAVTRALGPGNAPAGRHVAARQALAIAEVWQDCRTGFAWLTLGRVTPRSDPTSARSAFVNSAAIYRANGLRLHAAFADLQRAMFALSDGAWADALDLARSAEPAARAGQNASILAGLLMVEAAALDRSGRPDEARAVRLDSLGWARYGMASDAEVRRRLATIDYLAEEGERSAP